MGCVKIFVLFIVHVYGHEHAHGADEFYLLLGVTPKPVLWARIFIYLKNLRGHV